MSKEASLPFAGIPPEMLDRTNALIEKEPDFSDIEVTFSHQNPSSKTFTLWSFLAPYKFRFFLALLLVAMTEILLLVGPYLVQIAIDKAIVPKDFSILLMVAMAWVGSLFLAVIISGIRIRFLGRLGQLLMYDLRVSVFSHLQRLSLDFFTEEKAGRLLTRMTSDIEALSNLLQTGLVNLIAQLLALFFILILLFSFSLQLTLILLIFSAPVMFGFTFWFSKTSERGYAIVRNRIADVLAYLQESLSGMRLVISFNRMKHNVINHRNIVGDYRDANNYTSKITATYRSGTQFITTVTSVLIFAAGFFMVAGDLELLTDSILDIAPALLVSMQFSRSMEQDADNFAIKTMKEHGKDPSVLADMLLKLHMSGLDEEHIDDENQGLGLFSKLLELLSTHPDMEERVENIKDQSI